MFIKDLIDEGYILVDTPYAFPRFQLETSAADTFVKRHVAGESEARDLQQTKKCHFVT